VVSNILDAPNPLGRLSVFFEKAAKQKLGGVFQPFIFHPYLGKIPILTNIVQRG